MCGEQGLEKTGIKVKIKDGEERRRVVRRQYQSEDRKILSKIIKNARRGKGGVANTLWVGHCFEDVMD